MSLADEIMKLEELRRGGALSDEEFTRAKDRLLREPPAGSEQKLDKNLVDQLNRIQNQNELARIDRAWQIESEEYLNSSRLGGRQVPTEGMGIVWAVVGGSFGALWTIMGVSITALAPNAFPFYLVQFFFLLFGIVFTVGVIWQGVLIYSRAKKYQEAWRAYQDRRARARPG